MNLNTYMYWTHIHDSVDIYLIEPDCFFIVFNELFIDICYKDAILCTEDQ